MPVTTESGALEAVRALARASRLLERASGELSLAHYRVLAAIEAGEERASRLASRLALGKPTISAAVDALCERGLVERHAVSADHRASALALTPEGRAALDRAEAAMVARLRAVLEPSEQAEEIWTGLVALGRELDDALAAARPRT